MQEPDAVSFPRATPESQGVDTQGILDYLAAVAAARMEMHSIMLVRHGKVLAEGWWKPYESGFNHATYSLSKTFTGIAVGMAVDEGIIALDDKVISFFPDQLPAAPGDNLGAMTIHHLLSMNTGHIVDPGAQTFAGQSWIKGFLASDVDVAPGSHFLYNTPASYMCAAILAKVTGQTLVEYLTPRLFEPLGIQNPQWIKSPEGINTGGFGLSITTEDMARLGQFLLQRGAWQGRQLVSAAWVERATSVQSVNGYCVPGIDSLHGYGYQVWLGQHDCVICPGAFGQYCVVFPELDFVVAHTAAVLDLQAPLDLIHANLLPAVGDGALPANPVATADLDRRLSDLSISPMQGKLSSEVSASVLGVWYRLPENEFQVLRVRIVEDAGGWTALEFDTPHGIERTPIGFGAWTEGCTRLYAGAHATDFVPTRASGAWQTPDTWRADIRMIESPQYMMVSLAFCEDKVVFGNEYNVNIGPTKFAPIVGTRE